MVGPQFQSVNSFIAHSEPLLKLGTVVLGSLYVIGLLISNVQLMELGVSDFTALQVRNVMTGCLFLLYAALTLVVVAPVPFALYQCRRALTSKRGVPARIAICLTVVGVTVLGAGFITYLTGIFMGYLFPWGRTWDAGLEGRWWTWQFMWADLQTGFRQFLEGFDHAKTIAAGLVLAGIELATASIVMAKHAQAAKATSSGQPFMRGFVLGTGGIVGLSVYSILALALLLVGFANDVYPNIKYNLGGGQPSVAEIQIGGDDATGTQIAGIVSCCPPGQSSASATTEPLVIWYQSDKFLYVSPLSGTDRPSTRLVAFDLEMVQTIRHLPRSVRVESGGRVLRLQ